MLPALFVFHQKSSFSFRFFLFFNLSRRVKNVLMKSRPLDSRAFSTMLNISHLCADGFSCLNWKKLSFVSLASKCLFIFYWFRSGLVVSCSVLFTKQLADDARVTFNVCLFLLCSTTFNAPTYWDLACTKYMIIFEFFSYKKDVLYALN